MNNPNLAHPKSLEDLEKFFVDNNIPQEKVRFFINEDMKEAKCFGVYIDPETFEYVVYKNKSDGSRFERYRGNNEQEAVNIFFNKYLL